MQPEKTFEQYLRSLKHTEQTIKSYLYTVNNYLAACPNAKSFNYRDVVEYMTERSKGGMNVKTKIALLSGIKKYYDFLVDSGRRMDHPCRTLHFKGASRNRDVILTDLFTSQELELLLDREERYQILKVKNQVITSLLIFQGMTAGEVRDIKLQHIDLDSGRIFIEESRKLAKRYLEIQPRQYRMLDIYIRKIRPELQRTETDQLLLGKLGTPITVDDVNYIVSTFKGLFPDRNLNPLTMRQSVISNWLNEKRLPLEQVQLMAGHRWISSTAKYRQTNMEEQREMMNRFFPIG